MFGNKVLKYSTSFTKSSIGVWVQRTGFATSIHFKRQRAYLAPRPLCSDTGLVLLTRWGTVGDYDVVAFRLLRLKRGPYDAVHSIVLSCQEIFGLNIYKAADWPFVPFFKGNGQRLTVLTGVSSFASAIDIKNWSILVVVHDLVLVLSATKAGRCLILFWNSWKTVTYNMLNKFYVHLFLRF